MGPLQLLSRIVKEKSRVVGILFGMEIEWNGIEEWNWRGLGETFSLCTIHTKVFFGYLETVLYFWGHVATCTRDFNYLVSFIILGCALQH